MSDQIFIKCLIKLKKKNSLILLILFKVITLNLKEIARQRLIVERMTHKMHSNQCRLKML